jgi:D-alanyl-lipoteichoic acid acyltransferase DltB (MBOAT superfamily)
MYIPLGGNRVKEWRKHFNIAIVFIVSGIWHGASLSFAVWGGLWALYMIIGSVTKKWRDKIEKRLNVNKDCFSYGFGQVLFTFILTCFAWIFFRAPSVKVAVNIVMCMTGELDFWSFFNGALYELGLSRQELNILLIAAVILFLVDLIKYRKGKAIDVFLLEQNVWFSWAAIIFLVMFIFIFGIYGFGFNPQQFIYFTF